MRSPVGVPLDHPQEAEETTRERLLQLVASSGPVTAAELAAALHLTQPAIRRHLGVLTDDGQIAVHEAGHPSSAGPARRGRPAKRYVVTGRGQTHLRVTYSEVAVQAMRFLAEVAGPQAVAEFAAQRVAVLEERYAPVMALAGTDTTARTAALAKALADDGYASSARPVAGMQTVQLCQGHCPVQEIAAEFPQLCEAETNAFSRLLGVHVQRLATLPRGGHVCTTNVPIGTTAVHVEGTTP